MMTAIATVTFQSTVPAKPMAAKEMDVALAMVRAASDSGKPAGEDGTRVHVHYKAFGKPTAAAIAAAQRAADLGLPHDRYTGRVSRVWTSAAGDRLVTLYVELERDHTWRTLNLTKGDVYKFVVLGD